MAQRDVLKHIWAGIFFVLGMFAIAGAIFFIGYQKGLARPQFPVVVLFDKVGGLIEGASVRLSGVNVGAVKSIDFADDQKSGNGVKVTLAVMKRFEPQIMNATRIAIQTEGVLGAKYVEIARDPEEAPLDLSKPVEGEPLLDVYDLAEIVENTAVTLEGATGGLKDMVGELKNISRKTKRLLDRIEQRVIEGNLIKVF